MRVASRIMVPPRSVPSKMKVITRKKWPELVRTAPTPTVLKCYKNQQQVAFRFVWFYTKGG